MKSLLRLSIVLAALVAANLVLLRTESLRAEPAKPCYNKLCQVTSEYPMWSYCYGWPFGNCVGVGNCCNGS